MKLPWKPNGTRRGRWTRATSSSVSASSTTTLLSSAPRSWHEVEQPPVVLGGAVGVRREHRLAAGRGRPVATHLAGAGPSRSCLRTASKSTRSVGPARRPGRRSRSGRRARRGGRRCGGSRRAGRRAASSVTVPAARSMRQRCSVGRAPARRASSSPNVVLSRGDRQPSTSTTSSPSSWALRKWNTPERVDVDPRIARRPGRRGPARRCGRRARAPSRSRCRRRSSPRRRTPPAGRRAPRWVVGDDEVVHHHRPGQVDVGGPRERARWRRRRGRAGRAGTGGSRRTPCSPVRGSIFGWAVIGPVQGAAEVVLADRARGRRRARWAWPPPSGPGCGRRGGRRGCWPCSSSARPWRSPRGREGGTRRARRRARGRPRRSACEARRTGSTGWRSEAPPSPSNVTPWSMPSPSKRW